MCLSDEKDLSHSQEMTGSLASTLKEIDTFGKATESTIFRVDTTEFGKSVLRFTFSQLINHFFMVHLFTYLA